MLRIKLLLSAALQVVLFGSLPLSAQATGDPLEPVTINEIKIVGNHLVSTDKIISVMRVRKGDLYSRDKVMDDLKAINRIGCFDDRKLDINPVLTDGGVVLTIKVVENPVIKRFVYKGNTKIADKDLAHLFDGQVGLPQNIDSLSKAIDEVDYWYHSRGYVLAKVADVKDRPDGTTQIVIDEGKLSAVEITGLEPTDKTAIARQISVIRSQIYNDSNLINELRQWYGRVYGDITRSIAVDKNGSYVLKIQFLKRVQVGQPSGCANWHGVRGYRAYDSLVESTQNQI